MIEKGLDLVGSAILWLAIMSMTGLDEEGVQGE